MEELAVCFHRTLERVDPAPVLHAFWHRTSLNRIDGRYCVFESVHGTGVTNDNGTTQAQAIEFAQRAHEVYWGSPRHWTGRLNQRSWDEYSGWSYDQPKRWLETPELALEGLPDHIANLLINQVVASIAPSSVDVRLVIGMTERLLGWLTADPNRLLQLSPQQQEDLIADRFSAMGHLVLKAGKSNRPDGGIDMIAVTQTHHPILIAVQVKSHRAKERLTGVKDVREFGGVLGQSTSPFHLGFVVTNTSFTSTAKLEAELYKPRLRLRDFLDLCRWIKNDFGGEAESRELPDVIELGKGMRLQIPKKALWTPLAPRVQ